MSEDGKAEKQTPTCPLCGGISRLKEVLRHLYSIHTFYICEVCEIQFPVIAPRE